MVITNKYSGLSRNSHHHHQLHNSPLCTLALSRISPSKTLLTWSQISDANCLKIFFLTTQTGSIFHEPIFKTVFRKQSRFLHARPASFPWDLVTYAFLRGGGVNPIQFLLVASHDKQGILSTNSYPDPQGKLSTTEAAIISLMYWSK